VTAELKNCNRAIVVDHLHEQLGHGTAISVIYCNYKEAGLHSPVNLMASLWRQLVFGQPMPDAVRNLHRRHDEPGTRPSLSEVMELLQLQIRQYSESNVFVIVDALDECTEENNIRQTVLRELCSILPKIHLMVTSRPHINIISDIPELVRLEIFATDEDLRRFVNERMRCDHQLSKHIKTEATLQQDILNAVVSKAEAKCVSSTLIYIDFSSRPNFHFKILAG